MVLGPNHRIQNQTNTVTTNIVSTDSSTAINNNIGVVLIVVVVISLIIGVLIWYFIKTKLKTIHTSNQKYQDTIYTHCSVKPLNKPLRQSFEKRGINFVSVDNLNVLDMQQTIIYIPCNYNTSDNDINLFFRKIVKNTKGNANISIKQTTLHKWITAAVLRCNKLCAKNGLWTVLESTYGRKQAITITPESWVIPNQSDVIRRVFASGSVQNSGLIFKKNIQGKQGLLLTNSSDDIQKLTDTNTAPSDKYSVAQRYIDKPYLIQGRKLNIRLYVLVTVSAYSESWWLYTAGKCIYTNQTYKPLAPNTTIKSGVAEDMPLLEQHFTSLGLNTDKVYIQDRCPETLDELLDYMSTQGDDWDSIWQKIQLGLQKVARAYAGKLTSHPNTAGAYQIFGVDYILAQPSTTNNDRTNDSGARRNTKNKTLTSSPEPYLLEFNKGPEMKYKSPKDNSLKSGLQIDILDLVLGQQPTPHTKKAINTHTTNKTNKWLLLNSVDKSKNKSKSKSK